jgi:predicted enzyme related to lactoylglutathione lyase
MEALRPVWVGVPTEDFGGTVAFFHEVMGLGLGRLEEDFAGLHLRGGGAVEVFGPSFLGQAQFATGPAVGFQVEDVAGAREEMEAKGVEFIGPVHSGEKGAFRSHFEWPGGEVYEIMQVPDRESIP